MRISWVWSNRKRQKKLVPKDIHINNNVDMLIDNSPSPPSSVVVVSTNSGRNEESISSTVNTTPLVVRDQVPKSISSTVNTTPLVVRDQVPNK